MCKSEYISEKNISIILFILRAFIKTETKISSPSFYLYKYYLKQGKRKVDLNTVLFFLKKAGVTAFNLQMLWALIWSKTSSQATNSGPGSNVSDKKRINEQLACTPHPLALWPSF